MFVHLHVHSDNTILNGVIKVDKIVKKAKEYGMPAVALTDNGSMYATPAFSAKCAGEQIKPIFGLQVFVAPRTRFDKEAKKDEKTSELVLLAKNLEGYHNLLKISSRSHLEGFYYKPRVDLELLEMHKEGIIVLSGGANGEIAKNLYLGAYEEAEEIAKKYKKVFVDNYFLEIQRLGLHSEEIVNPKLIELSKKLKIQLVATNDVFYEKEEDSEAREVLWCIDSGRLMSDPARKKPESTKQYFRSPEEMEELFKDIPEAIENTVKIAESMESFKITYGKVQPVYPNVPKSEDEASFLRKKIFSEAKNKFGYYNKDLEDRLEYELGVIHDMGYDGYFLVVSDIVNWARSQGIMVSNRGSAAASAISYVLGITVVDPIKWRMPFERFLSRERPTLPDIDLDIADDRREEVINYVKQNYGEENVCNVGALGKLTTKAAIRDVGRVLGIELNLIDRLSKLVPVKFGKVLGINGCVADELRDNDKEIKVIDENREKISEFRKLIKDDGVGLQAIKFCETCKKSYSDADFNTCKTCEGELKTVVEASPRFLKLIKYVQKIENGIRNVSTHACGYLITPSPVIDYCPVQKESRGGEKRITQFEGKYFDDLGLMKFDFLGLINLSVIQNTVRFVKESQGIEIDIYNVPKDDANAFKLLHKGDTTAVFQLEGSGMRKYLKELEPHSVEEIAAMIALYRPGPIQNIPSFINRKHGREEITYLIPELKPILEWTYGIPVYQEQIMYMANQLAGYSLGEAYILIKAIGKKKADLMAMEGEKFVKGIIERTGHSEETARKIWEYALPFADYAFNIPHSAVYAHVAYWTAYLKANYPTEFFAALMLSDIENLDKLVRDIIDAEAHNIKLLSPSINKSDVYFTIEEEGIIRFGIGGLKGVGVKAITNLVNERRRNGEFTSLDDLCNRIDHKSVPKGAIEALIKIGAMEEFGSRAALLQIFEDIYIRSQKVKALENSGLIDMFSAGETKAAVKSTPIPDAKEVEDIQKIQWEREILGLALTPSLISKMQPFFKAKKYFSIEEIHHKVEKTVIKMLAQIKTKKIIVTKKGDNMCFVDLIDFSGKISVTLFPKTFAEQCEGMEEGDYLAVKGKTQKRNDEMQVIADEVKIFKEAELTEIYQKWKQKNPEETNSKTTSEINGSENKDDKSEKFESSEPNSPKPTTMVRYPVQSDTKVSMQEVKTNMSVSEPYTPYSSDKPAPYIEIFIKKDAFQDQLKKLSELFRQNRKEKGVQIILHVPNYISIRKIKLEGFYDEEISKIEDEIIEKKSLASYN